MRTPEQVLDMNGFDFEQFKYENEYSGKNLLLAMKEYAKEYHENEVVSRRCYGTYYNRLMGMEVCKHRGICPHLTNDITNVGMRHDNIRSFRSCKFHNGD